MRFLGFCENCRDENEYSIREVEKTANLNGEEIIYTYKEAHCKNCGNEIYIQDISNSNLRELYEKYRKSKNIISITDIENIMIKYNISNENLCLLLGFDEGTVSRYLDGDIPTNNHSDILRKIYINPEYYSIILQSNKERINVKDYNKSRQSVRNIIRMDSTEDKIYSIIKYIINREVDFTPFSLQKLLYYVQGFYYIFTNEFIFKEECEAWINGPVYRSVYYRYEKFGIKLVNKEIISKEYKELSDIERNVVESVIKFYGCYSGKVLEKMTNNEAPWVLTRTKIMRSENDSEFIDRKLIIDYFEGIKDKYSINEIVDIGKYSKQVFEKISI